MTRILITILCWLSLSLMALADTPRPLASAMQALRGGDWDRALQLADRDGPVARDVIEWHRLRQGLGDANDVIRFLKRRPDWPGLPWLRRESEAAVTKASHSTVAAFFKDAPPKTAEGVLSYARALSAAGQNDKARDLIVTSWKTLRLDSAARPGFLESYAKTLAPHHVARLDHLLWNGWFTEAREILPLVSTDMQKLALARMALRNNSKGVDDLIADIPDSLQNDPGLAFDRFVWRDRKGRTQSAVNLLQERSTSAASLGRPDDWASRRRNLARRMMRDGKPQSAYQIASQHYLTQGSDFADLEWLSGYIALRYLGDPSAALAHFQNHDQAVTSPISKGRAGYWRGRALMALGDSTAALLAYIDGSEHQTSFYGLLAAEAAGLPFDTDLSGSEPFQDWRTASFRQSSVFQAGLLLLASGELSLAERFLTHLSESLSRTEAGQLGQMAIDMNEPHLAVMIGKRVAQSGLVVPGPYYALHPMHEMSLSVPGEMALAIARRESEFDPVVVSGVGARGLMQIMPATAKEVASKLGLSEEHNTDRLLTDWQHNATLGSAFLSTLAGRFDGNVAMMAAAYNAGPSRPNRWMQDRGDPRGKPIGDDTSRARLSHLDIVDWIEHIPFNETRNYVMRVTESLPVYRARLGHDPLPIPFSQELAGSTLRAFAPKGE